MQKNNEVMKKWMTVLLLLLCMLPALQGQTREELRAEAEAGNAKAQYQLGSCHMFGKAFYADDVDNAPVDYDEAEKWFLKAAAQGYVNAYFDLGLLYQYDRPDKQKAIEYYKKHVAATGNKTSIKNLRELGADAF